MTKKVGQWHQSKIYPEGWQIVTVSAFDQMAALQQYKTCLMSIEGNLYYANVESKIIVEYD